MVKGKNLLRKMYIHRKKKHVVMIFSTFRSGFFLTLTALVFLFIQPCLSQGNSDHPQAEQGDSLTRHEKRMIRRIELKQSKTRCNFSAAIVFASLQTKVSFESPAGLLSAKIGLEKHLGLPSEKIFYIAGFRYRFTPASGISATYYGINRKEEQVTTQDIIFLKDTIKAGQHLTAWFNTQVISVGYMLSIMQDPKAFLGLFINVSLMNIKTGVQSDIGKIDQQVKLIALFPNFGVIADFRILRWLSFAGDIGFFSLHTDSFGGTIYDLKVGLAAKPVRWLGLSLAYQEFDVNLFFPDDKITVRAEYNFRGPALGIHFIF